MNSYERYRAMLAGQPVDRVPCTPILMHFAVKHIGSDYARFAFDYRVRFEANLACARDFRTDQVSTMSDPFCEATGFGGQITYVKDGVPRCTPPLAQTKDLAVLAQPDPQRSPRMLDRIDLIRAYQEHVGGQYSILGWVEGPAAEAADLRGVSTFLVDLLKDPPFAADLMDRCVEVGIEFARAQVAAGADTIGVGDAIASQISPRIYERLIQPRERCLIAAIKDMGALVKLHICGNITHLLAGIADLPIDIIDVDHMVDLRLVRERLGRRVAITGNIDPVSGVQDGTPASIRRAVAELYAQVGEPYLINAGCEIPGGTPDENLLALCTALET
jgi:MtaA/CmuA family methyltransferase